MSFADDLLEQASFLANRESDNPRQASLRRAVSTAYYALFHLLIDEVVGHWAVERQRSTLARTFDHGRMKSVCDRHTVEFFKAGCPPEGAPLKNVAEGFCILQQQRHLADYDNSIVWLRKDAQVQIDVAIGAFEDWQAIRNTEEAQDFLLALFLPRPPRV